MTTGASRTCSTALFTHFLPWPFSYSCARSICACLMLLTCGSIRSAFGQGGIITTFAGGGVNGTTALTADLGQPGSVSVDPSGNIIVSATFMNEVFKIDTQGNFSVLAGTGVAGFSGDNGPATAARLFAPWGVATDKSGNVFVVDTNNQRIRRIDGASGTITTVAGNGTYAFSGDGGVATSASLFDPEGIAIDAIGNLFIADYGNCRVRRVDASSAIITTVAGNGSCGFGGDGGPAIGAQLSRLWSVALDGSGNLFIADTSNYRVRRVDASTQVITTIAGGGSAGLGDGGPAVNAFLNTVFGVVVDQSGNLFIPDAADERVRRVDAKTAIITTVAGNGNPGFAGDTGPATTANLNFPMSVALDSASDLIIADAFNNRVRRVDAATGKISTFVGGGAGGDGSPATSATFVQPYGISIDSSGNIFIADTLNERIRRVDASTGNITTVAGTGWQGASGDGGAATSSALFDPRGVAVDSLGKIYIGNAGNSTVREVGPSGTISSLVSTSLETAGGVAVDASGDLFITNSGTHQILRVDHTSGAVTVVAGNGSAGYTGDGGPATSATLSFPQGVAIDTSGNLFVADTNNNVIRRVDANTGIISTVAGTGLAAFTGDGGPATAAALSNPERVAVDSADNLFVADLVNNRIRRVDGATGVISTVAGNGFAGFSGDGGQAVSASLNTPADVAIDPFGYLYIVELWNNRVRRVSPPPNATLSANSLTFTKEVVGFSSPAQTITLGNTGPQMLGFSGAAISGTNSADFALTHNCGATLTAKLSCELSVTFTPTATGSRTAVLTITDTSSDSPQTVSLSGSGVQATETVQLTPNSLSFGTVLNGTTASTQSVTLANSGNNSLNIAKIAVAGTDFSETNTCGASVAAGATCTITVSYTPSSSGINQTHLAITDDGINSPQSVSLSGSGSEFLLAPAQGSSTTQTVAAGTAALYSLILAPSPTTRDTVTLSCSGAPVTVSCSVQPAVQTFTSSASVPVSVIVSTTARGVVWQTPSDRFFPPIGLIRFLAYLAFAAFLIEWARCHRVSSKTHHLAWQRLVVSVGILSIIFMAACGGGGSSSSGGTAAGTYNLTVTAKSASSSNPDQTVTLTLNVQ